MSSSRSNSNSSSRSNSGSNSSSAGNSTGNTDSNSKKTAAGTRKFQILIVDDELMVRSAVRNLIDWESINCRVAGEAANGKEALEILRNNPSIHLVLLDIFMPRMGGLELMEHIRELERPPLVLILSANDHFNSVRQAFKLGAVNYILKSELDEKSLLAEVRKTLEKVEYFEISPEEEADEEETGMFELLVEDLLTLRHYELTLQLLANRVKLLPLPCRLALFWFPQEAMHNKLSNLLYYRGKEYISHYAQGYFQLLSGDRAVFFIPWLPGEVSEEDTIDSFCRDFQEILRISFNINPDYAYGSICTTLKDLSSQYQLLAERRGGESRIVRRAKRYIREQYANPELSLEEVSRHVEVSRTHLSALFSKESGVTFSYFLMRTRIEEAKKLLEESCCRIYEVSDKVGYPNVEHFSRLFKKVTGVTPGNWKSNPKIDQ